MHWDTVDPRLFSSNFCRIPFQEEKQLVSEESQSRHREHMKTAVGSDEEEEDPSLPPLTKNMNRQTPLNALSDSEDSD